MDAISAAGAATGGDGGTGENASELISRALREVSSVSAYEERIAQMEQMLTDIDNLLSDFNHEISSYLSGEEFDDEVFYQTEKRLDEINHLKSKYGNTMEEILQSAEEKTKRIVVLQDYDKYLNDLLTSMNRKKEELDGLCAEVSGIRKKAAKGLTKAIAQALEDLNFLDVQFTMEFRKTEYSAGGWDEAEFMISTNPGEPLKPLGKVASGGELSRIALAVKTVMADTDEIPTLIFDEIDSGISGRTAQMVSQKMKLLAKTHQIICITHLPQIAAMADAHFLIEKSVEHASTVSRIHPLREEESIEELARMLGGVEITDTVLSASREAVTLCVTMTGILAFWQGLMEIAKDAGLTEVLCGKIRPLVCFLFPEIPEDHPAYESISMNFIANFLGLGMAATPAGLKAMKDLENLEEKRRIGRIASTKPASPGMASREMCTFLIMNISSLQLIPVTMIAYRSQYGSMVIIAQSESAAHFQYAP